MSEFEEISEKIKNLKQARKILHGEYEKTDFHKRKEEHPQSSSPPQPEDEETFKLLTAIQQIEKYIKEFQEKQFELLKEQEKKEEDENL
ncbi:MAG: hypothetical protein V5A68_05630 [Candidatus Thermoplasmatota archaeon]